MAVAAVEVRGGDASSGGGVVIVGLGTSSSPSVVACQCSRHTCPQGRHNHSLEGLTSPSFIDRELLIQILSNQNLIEKLFSWDNGPATKLQTIQNPSLSDPPSVHVSRTEAGAPSLAVTPSVPFYPPLNRAGPVSNPQPPPEIVPVPSPPAGAHVAKDINYYKSLIQQHGGEKQEILPQSGGRHNQLLPNPESINNPKPRDLKPKIMKPCIYFNKSRGCRHGANCSYQHDVSSAPQQVSGMPKINL
ncbi:zinc finger CCCH domain-containing protein 6-like [Cornus florida]|uniref:zinc finger CCCH domain-containing protein 6-like n=1 Tax=Cornus florida TaxID=4283 RepID=UPI00289A8EEF|nr:zinc finger CCCH domain-containing protein 6-like [Cornus florida]